MYPLLEKHFVSGKHSCDDSQNGKNWPLCTSLGQPQELYICFTNHIFWTSFYKVLITRKQFSSQSSLMVYLDLSGLFSSGSVFILVAKNLGF